MRRKVLTPSFLKSLALFVRRHPDLEDKSREVMGHVVTGDSRARIHPLHGPLKELYAIRISHQYRIVFVLEPDAVVFIDIGSHDEVY